jgi:Type VI secretion system/phage-baseplate injector OB domain
MEELFEIWHTSSKASQIALDSVGRHNYPVLGIVTNNDDPENKRRVKVSLASSPALESDWLRRLLPSPFIDPPLPTVGQTVMVLYAEGVETNGYYINLMNATNPPRDKESVKDDYSEGIPGNREIEIGGNDSLLVKGELLTETDKSSTHKAEEDYKVEVKRNILMDALNAITLTAAQYVMLKAGQWFIKLYSNGTTQMGGGVLTIDCGGHGIHFVNTGTMSINGKEIATLDATTNEGDVIVNKGW